MSSFIQNIVILLTLFRIANGVWNSNLYTADADDSSEEVNISFKSANSQYYNSREAHGDIIDIEDGENVTRYHYDISDEDSYEEHFESIGTNKAAVVYSTVDKHADTSFESSELTELMDVSRLLPGLQDYPPPTDMPLTLPLCSSRKKGGKKQKKCEEEQNLCRSNGDCRITRIWGGCCQSPGCGTYCKPMRSKCPHPNSIREACDASDQLCNPRGDDCPKGTDCCQVLPCGYRCV